jgi:phage terminase large subunit-like protein
VTNAAELLARLRAMPTERRRAALLAAGDLDVRTLDCEWPVWARRGQVPPEGDWTVWVLLCGRGFGKTRAGSEWISAMARAHPDARIALVAATPAEARRVMVEGRSGLIAAAQDGDERRNLRWEPSLGRLTFASGAQAFVYSGADGESLRGPEHHFAWCDELPKWRRAQAAWDNLLMGLRAGTRPQAVVTTTPRAVDALKAVLATPGAVRTGGSSRDNPFVAEAAVEALERLHGGTRWGRQELEGELIEELEGALWSRGTIESARVAMPARDSLRRVVVGVDPPVTRDGDECGIIVCGVGDAERAYVLDDRSAGGLSPEGWARRVAAAADEWAADRVVAEGNQGGEMVESVLRGAGLRLGIRRVHARVGKVRRAEPVAALFERGEARIAGRFPALEDQLCALMAGGDYEGPGKSPDRADAMVWALTELMLSPRRAEPRVRRLG